MLAAMALVLAAGLDLAFGKQASLTVTLVFGPFVASSLLPPRDTAAFGAVAVVGAIALGWPDATAGTAAHVVRAATVALGAVLAIRLAQERANRESKLAAVTTIAEVAQLAILHPLPAEIPPLRLAGRYRSATAEARVGGDFYDALSTPFGARFIVGDVRGKGLDAVRLAALLLGEFRSRASTEADLGAVVSRLDHVAAERGGPEDFATAIVGESRAGGLRLVRCGHPHPVRRRDGEVSELPLAGTVPLGFGADGTAADDVPLDGQLLFFSDGSIETRDASGQDFDIRTAFARAPSDGQAALQHVLDELATHADGVVEDDVVLILLEPIGSPIDPTRKELMCQ
jgi:serine phosphatase RsbU (regulator of sigma subunit)